MTSALIVGVVAIVALLVLAWSGREERRVLGRELDEARRSQRVAETRLEVMTNRLVAAWEEGKIIPPPEAVTPEPEPEPLDPLVEEWCQQWEAEPVRQKWRNIAAQYRATGMVPSAVVKALEERLGR